MPTPSFGRGLDNHRATRYRRRQRDAKILLADAARARLALALRADEDRGFEALAPVIVLREVADRGCDPFLEHWDEAEVLWS
jgi:hypothetical protein